MPTHVDTPERLTELRLIQEKTPQIDELKSQIDKLKSAIDKAMAERSAKEKTLKYLSEDECDLSEDECEVTLEEPLGFFPREHYAGKLFNEIRKLSNEIRELSNRMNRLSPIYDKQMGFIQNANININDINIQIGRYNKTKDQTNRQEILREIYMIRRKMDNTYSESQIEACPEYYTIVEKEFFPKLQAQFKRNGIDSMTKVLAPSANSPNLPSTSFPELLANMAPKKVEQLLYFFSHPLFKQKDNIHVNLEWTYSNGEAGYEDFQNFLKTHTITLLNDGNSRSFKITPNTDGGSAPMVLRIEHRMDNPKSAEAFLRGTNSLHDTFIRVNAERLVYGKATVLKKNDLGQYSSVEEPCSRAIVVTEFCSDSNIASDARANTNAAQKIKSALTIYRQMGTILEAIRNEGCVFPDMKNANWLLDKEDKVRIADATSLIHTQNRKVDPKKVRVSSAPLKYSMDSDDTNFRSAEKMHALMLGKNIYQYLTGHEYNLERRNHAADFKGSVFATPQGKHFKKLIEDLAEKNPKSRLSVKDAVKRLELISQLSPERWTKLERDINESTIPAPEMKKCIEKIGQLKKNATEYAPLEVIERRAECGLREIQMRLEAHDLQKSLEELPEGEEKNTAKIQLQRLNTMLLIISAIEDLRTRSHEWFSVGMNKKADRIEEAMNKLEQHIDNNPNIDFLKSAPYKAVLEAMASQRRLGARGTIYRTNGEIDVSRAAKTFTFFKQALEPTKPPTQTSTANENENKRP